MQYLRARIIGVSTKSIRVLAATETYQQEHEVNDIVCDGEYTLQYWVPWDRGHIKMTLSLKDPYLYEQALSLMNSDHLIRVEGNKVVGLESVKPAGKCHLCNSLTFNKDFLQEKHFAAKASISWELIIHAKTPSHF